MVEDNKMEERPKWYNVVFANSFPITLGHLTFIVSLTIIIKILSNIW